MIHSSHRFPILCALVLALAGCSGGDALDDKTSFVQPVPKDLGSTTGAATEGLVNVVAYHWRSHTVLDAVAVVLEDNAGKQSSEKGFTSRILPVGNYSVSVVGAADPTGREGAIDLKDALATLKLAIGIDSVNGQDLAGNAIAVSPYQLTAADFNADGRVDLKDALEILKYSIGVPVSASARWRYFHDAEVIPSGATPQVELTAAKRPLAVSGNTSVGVAAVLTGDVDGSWRPSQTTAAVAPAYYTSLLSGLRATDPAANLARWGIPESAGSVIRAIASRAYKDGVETITYTDGSQESVGAVRQSTVLNGLFKVLSFLFPDGTSNNAKTPPRIAGVAAVGAPLSNATITLIDATGKIFTTQADANGLYAFDDLSSATPPFLISATAEVGATQVTHYALVTLNAGDAVANITPLTSAVASLVSPSALPSGLTPAQLAALTSTAVAKATDSVKAVVAPVAGALGLPASFDPLSSTFTADRTGADSLLDHLSVTLRASGVTISNRLAPTAESAESTAANGVAIAKNGTFAAGVSLPTNKADTKGLDALAKKFETCFALPMAQRLTNKTTTNAVLAPACRGIASDDFLHNGQPFLNRWALALNSPTMDGAKFAPPTVRLQVNDSPLRVAINFNFKDNAGVGYTKPEVAERLADGSWILVGNKRPLNFFSESALVYFDDVSTLPYNNTNSSRVDSGLRLSLDPRVYIGADSSVAYAALDMTQDSGFNNSSTGTFASFAARIPANNKMVGCVIARGPGKWSGTKWQGFHPNGILLKRPDSSNLQDYLAIDAIVPNAARTAINSAITAANGNFGAGQTVSFTYGSPAGTVSNICTYNFGNRAGTNTTLTGPTSGLSTVWETTQSASIYVVEQTALGARANVLTGTANDTAIAGRNVAWNTGARYAREAPSAELVAAFDSNPTITFEVFDTDGKLRAVLASRYIGELPPAQMAKEYIDSDLVSKLDNDTLKRYLALSAATDTVKQTQTSAAATWASSAKAFGADRISFYTEVQRAEPGLGIANLPGSKVNGLWSSDPDLAATLNAIPGDNFYWWNSGFAKPSTASGACSGNSLISNTGVGVSRQQNSFTTAQSTAGGFDGTFFGTDQLASACILATGSTTTKAYLYRELGTRTYTDTNTRLYYYVANKALR